MIHAVITNPVLHIGWSNAPLSIIHDTAYFAESLFQKWSASVRRVRHGLSAEPLANITDENLNIKHLCCSPRPTAHLTSQKLKAQCWADREAEICLIPSYVSPWSASDRDDYIINAPSYVVHFFAESSRCQANERITPVVLRMPRLAEVSNWKRWRHWQHFDGNYPRGVRFKLLSPITKRELGDPWGKRTLTGKKYVVSPSYDGVRSYSDY
jgi:hypothetical protein